MLLEVKLKMKLTIAAPVEVQVAAPRIHCSSCSRRGPQRCLRQHQEHFPGWGKIPDNDETLLICNKEKMINKSEKSASDAYLTPTVWSIQR